MEPTNEWYAIAKIAGIKLCEALRRQHDFDAISLMPTNLYGPGDNYHSQNSHVLPALIRRFYEAKLNDDKEVVCWGTGSPMREFLFIEDLGEACVFALENWTAIGDNAPTDSNGNILSFMNVGTGSDISIKSLAELIAKTINYDHQIIWDIDKPDGTPKKQLNVDKMSQLGWTSKYSLSDGLKLTIDDFQQKIKLNQLRI